MKLYTIVLVLLLAMIIIPDVFFYLKLKNNKTKPIYIILHLCFPLFFSITFLYIKFGLEHLNNFRVVCWIMWLYYFFILIYIPKLIHIVSYYLNYLYKRKHQRNFRFLNTFRIVISSIFVLLMLVSAYITPYHFEVTHTNVNIKSLPVGFNNYKIVQISDIHLGSWGNDTTKLSTIIDLVNKENPNLIIFTGDMVNNFATETKDWKDIFLKLKAKNAKFAILGNHDYGDYTLWKTKNMRLENQQLIKKAITSFGFQLLLNESVYLKSNNDSILLVGVENWGKTGATRYSDLNKALTGSSPEEIKILLTHDPNHWEAEVLGHKDIVLTLSGHTHAAQAGIKIGKKLFSPASFVFKYWAGLYKVNNQQLYVNRGVGYIGLPIFIGVRPEITVLTLKAEK